MPKDKKRNKMTKIKGKTGPRGPNQNQNGDDPVFWFQRAWKKIKDWDWRTISGFSALLGGIGGLLGGGAALIAIIYLKGNWETMNEQLIEMQEQTSLLKEQAEDRQTEAKRREEEFELEMEERERQFELQNRGQLTLLIAPPGFQLIPSKKNIWVLIQYRKKEPEFLVLKGARFLEHSLDININFPNWFSKFREEALENK